MSPATTHHTVLFVEGPALDRGPIVRAFEEHQGGAALAFTGPDEALRRVLAGDAAIVIVPDRVTGGDGLDLLRRMRDSDNAVPLVVLFEDAGESRVLSALRIGADECVEVPGGIAALPRIVERAMTRRRYGPAQITVRERIIGRSQEQWMAIFDAITDFVFVLDAEGRFVKVNRACAASLGMHPRDLIGRHSSELLGPEASWGCPDETGRSAVLPSTCERNIGEETYQISVFPLEESGRTLTIHIMKNVTENKRLKDQLYHADKLASLGLLVSGVAHEINNPLTGTIAYTELLRMTVTDEKVLGELQKISDSAERCKKIVDNLLTFSRQRTPSKSVEAINDIIDRAIELRSYWLRSSTIEVVRDYDDRSTVFVDAQQIQQVILNVLLNAEQAITGAGIRNGRIVFTTRYDREQKRVVVTVENNGPPIPEAMLPKIFDPFFTTKPVGVGTGLGLSISHGIITEHGGAIRAENIRGEGVRFVIEIPTGTEAIASPVIG